MSHPHLSPVGAAAAAHAADTAPLAALDATFHVSVYTDPRARRNRPYCVAVKTGCIVSVHRFADEAQRDLYALEARETHARLAEYLR